MNIMERKTVLTKASLVIDKITKTSELNELAQEFEGDIIITQKLVLDVELDIRCNLYVMGGIARRTPLTQADININGDLYCYGEIHSNNINVTGYFYSQQFMYSQNIKVGENFVCDDKVDVYGHNIIVAGDFKSKGVVAKKIQVLGGVFINGSIGAMSIKTGY